MSEPIQILDLISSLPVGTHYSTNWENSLAVYEDKRLTNSYVARDGRLDQYTDYHRHTDDHTHFIKGSK